MKPSTDRRQPAYRPRFHVCLLLLQSSLPPPTPLRLHPHPCPHNILPSLHPYLTFQKAHRRSCHMSRCTAASTAALYPLLPSVFHGPGRDPHVVAVLIPCEADSDRDRQPTKYVCCTRSNRIANARAAGRHHRAGKERRAWPHHISRCKQGKRARPAAAALSLSLSLAIGGAVALVINGVRGGNMQR